MSYIQVSRNRLSRILSLSQLYINIVSFVVATNNSPNKKSERTEKNPNDNLAQKKIENSAHAALIPKLLNDFAKRSEEFGQSYFLLNHDQFALTTASNRG